MLGNILKGFAYSTYFSVALVGFIYLSIPTGKVKNYVQVQASRKLKTKVEIDSLKLHGISGVTLGGITIQLPIKPPTVPGEDETDGAPGAMPGGPADEPAPAGDRTAEPASEGADEVPAIVNPPGLVQIDALRVDLNTVGLMMGKKLQAALTAEFTGGGSIEGATLEAKDGGWTLAVDEIAGINLAPMRIFKKMMDLDVNARLSGKLLVDWGGGIANSTASINMTLSDTVVPYLPIKVPPNPFPVGEAFNVELGDVEMEAQLGKPSDLPGVGGRARPGQPTMLLLQKFSGRGEHVEVQLDSGQKHTLSFVGPKMADTLVDIKLVVHFTDAFFAWKGDGVRADGSVAKDESHAGMKTGLASALRRARIRLGTKYYYGFHCKGRLQQFKTGPSPCRAAAPSRRIAPKLTGAAQPLAGKRPGSTAGKRPTSPKLNRPKVPPPSRAGRTPTRPSRTRATARPAGKLVERSRPKNNRRKPARRPRTADRDRDDEDNPEMLAPRGGGGEITPTVNEPVDEEESEGIEDDEEDSEDEEGSEDDEDDDEEDSEDDDGPIDPDDEFEEYQ